MTASEQITREVLDAVRGTSDERLRVIVAELVRHAHDFARDVRLQPEELIAAADFLKRCGQISDDARHEVILLSDVLGLTMVADTIAADVPEGALEGSVLGPFYRAGSPLEPNGANISRGAEDSEPAHVHGRVLDLDGRPVAGAELEVWGTNKNGLYENVDPAQPDYNLRGRFHATDDGRYELWTVKPVSYPIPDDGPVGDLLKATNRHNMRPAHIHVIAAAEGYRTIVTELFTDDDQYLGGDAVFGVRPSLVVHYNRVEDPRELAAAGRAGPFWDLERDLVLSPGERGAITFTTARLRDAS